MQESDEPNKPASASPEPDAAQLLKILDLQRQARPAPSVNPFSGMPFRYISLIVIILGTVAAVVFLEWFAAQLPRPAHPVSAVHASPPQ